MKAIVKISDYINRVATVLAVACSVGFVLCMLLQVTLRNFFPAYAVSWADPMCRYFFIWSVYIASIVITKEGGHITVTILPDALHGLPKMGLTIINNLLFFAVLITVDIVGYQAILLNSKRALDAVPFSAAWIYAAIPVFSVVAGFQIIVKTILDIKKQREELHP